jgi:hypothetical protein
MVCSAEEQKRMTDEIKDRINQAKEDRLRQNASSLKDHIKSSPGGRFAVDADKSPTTIKGGHGKGAGPWSGNDPNPLEPPIGIDISYVPPME